MQADLHCHTTASDGVLSPAALLEMQLQAGTALLAITDHDTLGAYDQVRDAAGAVPELTLIPGVEFSCRWGKREVHVLALGFEADNPQIRALIGAQHERRLDRARRVGAKFDLLGIPGAFDAAMAAADGGVPGRPHFARFLVESGRVADMDTAFRRYLADRKPAACATEWPTLEAVTALIAAADGVAVLAHPGAYELSRTKLRELLGVFAEAGGGALEIAMPGVSADLQHHYVRLAKEFGLSGSAGSDFHDPAQFWRHPSRIPALPDGINPVWENWV